MKKFFVVVMLFQFSAFALTKKEACADKDLKLTEIRMLKAKFVNDPHADAEEILVRMSKVVTEYKDLNTKCLR